jgi:hypothetical protein
LNQKRVVFFLLAIRKELLFTNHAPTRKKEYFIVKEDKYFIRCMANASVTGNIN